eukprot:CAMPEP_0185776912 /NCGR_PEP_ID=MMETSP1174-20130828/87597_1 /TAXON_ID=35687 /ORGANISM="Dictyocha speculum, Strain CCMP1381" /LENGTH=170 /DNA_ID=CAMNT_0028465089 /DNA_START=162 /DNA_END=675 /DNA_ORIENTATION=+
MPHERLVSAFKAAAEWGGQDLGVSNFNTRQIDELRTLNLAPVAVNQIQYNLWAPDYQRDVFAQCQARGVAITAWAPFQGTMMQHAQAFTVDTLMAMAASKGRTVPQLMLRWLLQKGAIVIPGTSNPGHMDENLAVYEFELSEEELAVLDGLSTDASVKDFVAIGFEQNES